MATSTNPVTASTTNVLTIFRDETGGLYMDVQVTVGAGSGPSPEPTGVHVYRVPVLARIS
jgi:hypothetical protein